MGRPKGSKNKSKFERVSEVKSVDILSEPLKSVVTKFDADDYSQGLTKIGREYIKIDWEGIVKAMLTKRRLFPIFKGIHPHFDKLMK